MVSLWGEIGSLLQILAHQIHKHAFKVHKFKLCRVKQGILEQLHRPVLQFARMHILLQLGLRGRQRQILV